MKLNDGPSSLILFWWVIDCFEKHSSLLVSCGGIGDIFFAKIILALSALPWFIWLISCLEYLGLARVEGDVMTFFREAMFSRSPIIFERLLTWEEEPLEFFKDWLSYCESAMLPLSALYFPPLSWESNTNFNLEIFLAASPPLDEKFFLSPPFELWVSFDFLDCLLWDRPPSFIVFATSVELLCCRRGLSSSSLAWGLLDASDFFKPWLPYDASSAEESPAPLPLLSFEALLTAASELKANLRAKIVYFEPPQCCRPSAAHSGADSEISWV